MLIAVQQVLRLSTRTFNKMPIGQLVNNLSNDVSGIELCTVFLNYIWISPVQVNFIIFSSGVALLLYFIYQEFKSLHCWNFKVFFFFCNMFANFSGNHCYGSSGTLLGVILLTWLRDTCIYDPTTG